MVVPATCVNAPRLGVWCIVIQQAWTGAARRYLSELESFQPSPALRNGRNTPVLPRQIPLPQ